MIDNFKINFSLKGFTSILIGGYIFITGYLIETILKNFLVTPPLTNISPVIIEILIIAITILAFVFSSLALFVGGKKEAKKEQYQLWNAKTKTAFQKYILGFIVIFTSLLILINLDFIDYLTPTYLILYGVLLLVFKNKERKNFLILSGISILLAIICFLIPSYWAASFSILGITHITYGVMSKE